MHLHYHAPMVREQARNTRKDLTRQVWLLLDRRGRHQKTTFKKIALKLQTRTPQNRKVKGNVAVFEGYWITVSCQVEENFPLASQFLVTSFKPHRFCAFNKWRQVRPKTHRKWQLMPGFLHWRPCYVPKFKGRQTFCAGSKPQLRKLI